MIRFILAASCGLSLLCPRLVADWPMYKHEARRNGVTEEKLTFPMRAAWTYTCAQPPSVAWRAGQGATARLIMRPNGIANGMVFLGVGRRHDPRAH